MITLTQGNLLEVNVEALVNPVNTVGVMGKGIALQFKRAFPQNFKAYKRACDDGELAPGKMFVFQVDLNDSLKYVVNFPTKKHWRDKSRIEYIQDGLAALAVAIKELQIKSIAIPALGCGCGGLCWNQVRPLIEEAFTGLSDVTAFLYEPL